MRALLIILAGFLGWIGSVSAVQIRSFHPNFITECGNPILFCTTTSENLAYGDSEVFSMYTLGDPSYSSSFGALVLTGSSDFTIVSENCSYRSGGPGVDCNWEVKYEPSSLNGATATATITTYSSHGYQYTQTYYFVGRVHEVKPLCGGRRSGSIVDIDTRTLGEQIPIVGTNFYLSYSSRFAPEYVSSYNYLGTKDVFNPELWTVSHHHYYDAAKELLFRGDGAIVDAKSSSDGAGHNIVISSDGSELYSFDETTGRHLATKSTLTNALLYSFGYTSNRLTSITDGYGNITAFNRASGNLTSIEAPFGQTTTITLNGSGQLSDVELPSGATYSMAYNTGTSLLSSFTKPGTQVSTFTYDGNGNLTQDLGNGGNEWNLSQTGSFLNGTISLSTALGITSTHQTYQLSGQYSRIDTNPDGSAYTHIEYPSGSIQDSEPGKTTVVSAAPDARFGSLLKSVSSRAVTMGGNTSTTSYSQSVNYPVGPVPNWFNYTTLTRTETTNSRVFSSVYTAATRTMATTSPEGATTSTQFNTHEQPTQFQVGGDTAWTYSYDTYGRLSGKAQGTKKTEAYTYDSSGNLQTITNVRSEVTTLSYDLDGRVTQITLPDTRVIDKTYDANGNLTSVTPPGRSQHIFGINSFEILGSYEPPSLGLGVTKNTTYTYNNDKQLTQISRPDGQNVDFTYHSTKGRLTSITTPGGNYGYHYNTTSQKVNKIESPYGIYSHFEYYGDKIELDSQNRTSDDLLFGQTSFTFDSDHRLSSRTIRGNAASPTSTINYTYNDDNQPTAVGDLSLTYSYPSGRLSGTSIDRISDSYSYDSYGDLVGYSAVYTPPVGTPSTYYSYTLTRDDGGRISQKVETIAGVTSTYVYSYDSAGRLTLVKKNGTTTDSFTYDDNSNRTSGVIGGTSFSATYDDQDRLVTLGPRTYTYNNNGDLTRIQWSATPSDKSDFVYDVMGNLNQVTLPSGTVLDYVNDGLDRRAVKKSAGSFVFRYLYENKYRISAIMNGMNAYVKEFVYATRVNVPDYLIAGGSNYKIITDHLGSPRLMVRTSDGVVAQRMDYSTLGTVTNDTNPGFQPFGFAGGIYDPSTQLVRFGARDYDPRSTGRWTTKDPIRFDGGDTNLYGYVLSDPINFIDPSGLLTSMPTVPLHRGHPPATPFEMQPDQCPAKSDSNGRSPDPDTFPTPLIPHLPRPPQFFPPWIDNPYSRPPYDVIAKAQGG